jgi:hypothetical protein
LGRLYDLNARWLAFGFEREIYIMPRQTALGFVQGANVIRQRAASMKSSSSRSVSGNFSNCGFQRVSYQEFFSKTERTIGIVDGFSRSATSECRQKAQWLDSIVSSIVGLQSSSPNSNTKFSR